MFLGYQAAALQHLKTARRLLIREGFETLRYAKPLVSCIAELGLMVQVSLPFPFTSLSLDRTACTVEGNDSIVGPLRELRQLLDIVCSDSWINFAIWSPMSRAEANVGLKELQNLRHQLSTWKATSEHTFRVANSEAFFFGDSANLQPDPKLLPIPPESQEPQCPETALTAVLYHCYMGRILSMSSSKSAEFEADRAAAGFHAYQILCLSDGIIKASSGIQSCQCQFLSHNAVKIALIPSLYLATQFSFMPSWQHVFIEQLHCLGPEGLCSGASFARTLECAPIFEMHARRSSAMGSLTSTSNNALDPGRSRIVHILIRSAEGNSCVAYYVRRGRRRTGSGTEGASWARSEIIGTAHWTDTHLSGSSDISLQFFGPNDPSNADFAGESAGNCIYTHIASQEPIALDWTARLGREASSPHGYFEYLAGLIVALGS